jgi:hypothetical protein
MRAPTRARPEFADGPRRPSRWTRLSWTVSFVVFSALTWWATYHHHAPIGVGVLIIIILVSVSVYSLYKAAEGNAQVVSAFAGIVVLSMTLAVFQKAPPRHPGKVLTQNWAPCPASRNYHRGAGLRPDPVAGLAHRADTRPSAAALQALLRHRRAQQPPARPVLGALHQGVYAEPETLLPHRITRCRGDHGLWPVIG